MCMECAKQKRYALTASLSLSLFLLLSPQSIPSKCILCPSLPIFCPLLLYINLFPGTGGTNPATTPQCHLPWGIKGWLSCYSLSLWDYLLPTAAHYDTCFHNLTHTASHSSSIPSTSLISSPFLSLALAIAPIFPFHFLMQPVLPSYSGRDTLHWRAAECREFLQHFHWLRATVFPACRLA